MFDATAMLTQIRDEHTETKSVLDGILARAEAETRGLTDPEKAEQVRLSDALTALEERASVYKISEDRESAAADLAATVAKAEGRSAGAAIVTRTAAIYGPDAEHSFYVDVRDAQNGSPEARERLHNAAKIEGRAAMVSSTFVLPVHLSEIEGFRYTGNPTSNAVRNEALPAQGTSFLHLRATNGASVGFQNGENTAVNEWTVTTEEVTLFVETIAALADVSWQSSDRGFATDQFIQRELNKAAAQSLERHQWFGAGHGSKQIPGINAAATAQDVGSGVDVYKAISKAKAAVNNTVKVPATVLFTSPDGLAFLEYQKDDNNRPLFVPAEVAPQNATGVAVLNALGEGYSGRYNSLAVYVSHALAGVEAFYVGRHDDIVLYRDGAQPRTTSILGAGNGGSTLTNRVVIHEYVAQDIRPGSIRKLSGAGIDFDA